MFKVERDSGTCSLPAAKATVTDELMKLWEYTGYGDILHIPLNIQRQIQSLHDSYKALNKIPSSRRNGDAFKKKKDDLLCTLKQLFDISVKQLQSSHLITDEDRDFLQNNWDKIISSTPDLITKAQIQKKLSRQQQSSKFCEAHSSTSHFPSTPVPEMDLIPISPEDSGDDFTPKRPRTTKGTTVTIPKDILSKLGPTADRLNLSGTQLAGIVAAVTNHSGRDINDIALSKSTARRHRCASISNQASSIKKDFNCDVGQVNFDGKLLPGLGGFGKVNRLAVILNQASVLKVQQTSLEKYNTNFQSAQFNSPKQL